jgi:hypothetical protein
MATLVEKVSSGQATTAVAVDSNVTSERQDFVIAYLLGKDDKGQVTKTITYFPFQSDEEKASVQKMIDEGKVAKEGAVGPITVAYPRAKNLAGIKQICPDEEEAANNFNRGAKQKANNRLKAIFTAEDANGNIAFDPETSVDEDKNVRVVNGVLDLTSEIASASKRRVLTEEEKLDKFLEQFPESTRAAMKSAYLASRQAAPAA